MARRKRKPSKTHRDMAKYVAMVIRNAMEEFHCKYLSDEQMKELNPIIRNAVCTALHAASKMGESDAARKFVEFQTLLIPSYWEEPELLQDFIESEQYFEKNPPA
jgi:hypothetical protein